MTIWALLEQAVRELPDPIARADIVAWFREHHPEVNERSLATHIHGATAAERNETRGQFADRAPLLERVGRGVYRKVSGATPPATVSATPPAAVATDSRAASVAAGAQVVLVSCTARKLPRAAPARELYQGAAFAKATRYAESDGLPWFVVSAKYGLLAPEDVVGPYDVRLDDCTPQYREAWGRFVVAQLAERRNLDGANVEVHASRAYAEPLRQPLEAAGAIMSTPLGGLRQGERLSWYNEPRTDGQVSVEEVRDQLADASRALSPSALRAADRALLALPGLYAWWVDDQGAKQLAAGLGHPLASGLVYLGQAGAARAYADASRNTLRGRLVGMHLGERASLSTFRRTLAVCLRAPLGLDTEDDPRLGEWMDLHLAATVVPIPDRERLRLLEEELLAALDPPLNLSRVPRTPLRAALSALRSEEM